MPGLSFTQQLSPAPLLTACRSGSVRSGFRPLSVPGSILAAAPWHKHHGRLRDVLLSDMICIEKNRCLSGFQDKLCFFFFWQSLSWFTITNQIDLCVYGLHVACVVCWRSCIFKVLIVTVKSCEPFISTVSVIYSTGHWTIHNHVNGFVLFSFLYHS